MTIQINGMAHVMLTVSRFEVVRAFYRELLPHFGMKPVFDGERLFYCVGGRRSAFNHAIPHTTVNALFSGVSAYIIFACVPVHVKTWIGSRLC
jgi:catechol 2,3-dioxygenase-like lactoylglutathione lyase family enzyme